MAARWAVGTPQTLEMGGWNMSLPNFTAGGLALQDARALSAHRGLGKRQRWTGGDPADLLSVFLWRLRVLQLLGSAASTAVYCFDSWPMQLRLRLLRLTAGSVGRAKWRRFARYRPPSFRRGEREATGLQEFSAQASLGPSRVLLPRKVPLRMIRMAAQGEPGARSRRRCNQG